MVEMTVCDDAAACIQADRLTRLRTGESSLESHSLFARLKVAAALALLDGALVVNDEDWQLAAEVMRVSTGTREAVRQEIERAQRSISLTNGIAAAETREAVDDAIRDKNLKRVKGVMLRALHGKASPEERALCGDKPETRLQTVIENCISTTRSRPWSRPAKLSKFLVRMSRMRTRSEGLSRARRT